MGFFVLCVPFCVPTPTLTGILLELFKNQAVKKVKMVAV
jgi:hypothetical protein